MPAKVVSSKPFKSMMNLLYKQKMGRPAHFRFPGIGGAKCIKNRAEIQ